MKLTVIFRNDGPMIYCGDCCSYRRVTIDLTEEQKEKLKPRFIGKNLGKDMFEDISKCFIETEDG